LDNQECNVCGYASEFDISYIVILYEIQYYLPGQEFDISNAVRILDMLHDYEIKIRDLEF
jgi:hypothetical protein